MKYKTIALLSGLALLQACTLAPSRVATGDAAQIWSQRQSQLSALREWQIKGRIGFVSETQSGSGSLYWQQQGDQYTCKVVAPFGKGSINISGDGDKVILHTADGEQYASSNVERLLWEHTGWIIPVQHLRYWMIGLPTDTSTERYALDQDGRIESLSSGEWELQYHRYRATKQIELPTKITVQGPELKIKVAVSQWQLP